MVSSSSSQRKQHAEALAARASLAGAVDLSALKEQAEAQRSRRGMGSGIADALGARGVAGRGPAASQPDPNAAAGGGAPGAPTGDGAASASPAAGAAPVTVIEVTDETFEDEVLRRSAEVPVVVDLWATWCGPCRQLTPTLTTLAEEAQGAWVLATVDVDANPGIAGMFRVQSVPTVIGVIGMRPVQMFSGAQPEAKIREVLAALTQMAQQALPNYDPSAFGTAETEPAKEAPEDARIDELWDRAEGGDGEGAARAARELADAEPDNAALAEVAQSLELRVAGEAAGESAVADADADPMNVDKALSAADRELWLEGAEPAFRRLTTLVARVSGDERERVRRRLLELFTLVGDDPAVPAARRALASALY